MVPNKVIAACASLAVLALSALAAYVLVAYMTQWETMRLWDAGGIALAGLLLATVLYRILARKLYNPRRCWVAAGVLAILLLAPPISIIYPGRITYARFGFTVYGIVPVPIVDITVGSHRTLWFRDKSHRCTLEEVQPLLSPDTEVVIIGIGWQSMVQVDEAVRNLKVPRVEILPTPDAFRLFNQCRSEGRKVVILAHSTC